ncbi:MAG: hypothetical protein RLZZ219_13 [Cyanobacteriota bacterium]
MIGGSLLGGGALWWGLDRAAGLAYGRLQPWLESLVGRVMGHPLDLGPYRGLRPWGVRIGPSRFRPGVDNPSTVEAGAVALRFDPLRSLLQRAAVLEIGVADARVELRRNSRGSYWQLGRLAPGREPPRLALRIGLEGPARVRLHPASGSPLALRTQARTTIQLHRRELQVSGVVLPSQGGSLALALQSHWQQRRWRLQLTPRALPLQPLVPFLPAGVQQQLSGRLQGLLTGQLRLRRGEGCQGALRITDVAWRAAVLPDPLRSELLALRCQRDQLRLQSSAVAMGAWRGRLEGALGLTGARGGQLSLMLQARESLKRHRLVARLQGPWRRPMIDLEGSVQGLRLPDQPPLPLLLRGRLALRFQPRPLVRVDRLHLSHGDTSLTASGNLWPRLQLRSDRIRAGRQLLRPLQPLLGPDPRLRADARLSGPWGNPRLELDLRQSGHPLLGPVNATLSWGAGLLRLERLRAPGLLASGELPLPSGSAGRLRPGPLSLRLDLRGYPLARLSGLIGSRLRGTLDAWGEIRGPLQALRPSLRLRASHPGVGPLQLEEIWQGTLSAGTGAGADLRLRPLAPAPPAALMARLDRRWLPETVQLQRAGGALTFSGNPRRYLWQARRFPLEGLRFALGPRQRFQPLGGLLSGSGRLDLQPLWIVGRVELQQPQLLGLAARSLVASGWYRSRRYGMEGRWLAERGGEVAIRLRGEQGGSLWSRFEARGLTPWLLDQGVLAWRRWRGDPLPPSGRAADLGLLAIETLGRGIDQQLAALLEARGRLSLAAAEAGEAGRRSPADLDGRFDADLTLSGERADRLFLDLSARGHLWWREQGRDLPLTDAPLTARLQGPLWLGQGSFDLQDLPLGLLALLTPVPEGLRGSLSARGSFGGDVPAGSGGSPRRRTPTFQAKLALKEAALRDQALLLERGELALEQGLLTIDLALRQASAASSIELAGRIPLAAQRRDLELRLASRGDGLRFLSVLAGPGVRWQRGSADLQLLVRGSLADPVANGFLRFREGELQLAGQTLRELEATVLFDFRELELQQLTARVGPRGRLSGSGQLALLTPFSDAPRLLRLQLQQAPFQLSRMSAQADGELLLSGSLRRPVLGGELRLSRGAINVQPGQLATEAEPSRPVTVRQLVEERWDFREPLLVMGQQMESTASRDLRESVPDLPFLSLRDLRLRLGPDLRVTVPNVLNFNSGGLLTLNGPLDASIRASGVVRLLNGRLGLFTTNFSLDPDAPNVAIFTPGLGLIPYLDIALRTRVSDSLSTTGAGRDDRSSIYDWNSAIAPFQSIDQLRLVRVRLEATGPADRLAENIRLTSSPPLPQERLVALIGGNSLVGLVGGNARAALATVLGQSLLSPLAGGLSDAFGQRLSFALYPTYFAPAETLPSEIRSRRLPSQLVLGSEIGLDLSERFNFSLLAAPNRSDIPPQFTLRYQASDRIGVQTSVDAEGRWQSQLQLFFRF